MNDAARDLLSAAWLRGHRQIKHWKHDPNRTQGECAMGLFHLTVHRNRPEAVRCEQNTLKLREPWAPCYLRIAQKFALSVAETSEIMQRNDILGQDFLTIARKTGVEPV